MVNIEIKSIPLLNKIEKRIIHHVVRRGEYGELSEKKLVFLENKVKKYNKEYKLKNPLTIDIFLSIRSAYVKQKIILRYKKLVNQSSNILDDYNKGTSIVELAKKYDHPPLNIFRVILKMKGYNKKKVKHLLRNPDKLEKRDYDQFKLAIENDIFTPIIQKDQKKEADEFEKDVGKWLDKHKVKYKTQEDLAKEQIKEIGYAVNTPDFLILSDLYVNGIKINWIDAKNFYGANTFNIKLKIKKQIKKYINKWTTGSIIFSQGFSEKLKFKDTVLVDYRVL